MSKNVIYMISLVVHKPKSYSVEVGAAAGDEAEEAAEGAAAGNHGKSMYNFPKGGYY